MGCRGLRLGAVGGNSAASACAKAALWQRPLRLLQQLSGEGVQLGGVSFSAGVHALANCKLWSLALAWAAEIGVRGVQPGETAWNALSAAFDEKGRGRTRWALALRLADRSTLSLLLCR
ncbi:unnamed protein product, partial [Effrenium voratum]